MVTRVCVAVLAVLLATSSARADDDDDEAPAFNMFGFRMTAGALPLDGQQATVLSVGLGVEHPVFRAARVRMFGEYEWLWMSWLDERAVDSVVIRPERYGNGHRASIGLRRELVGKNLGRTVRMFTDLEAGAAVALANDNMRGASFVPGGLVGLRLGYDVYSREDDSPSRTFEAEVLVRALFIDGGAGAMMGMGLAWGN
jgi:hypothetical protein